VIGRMGWIPSLPDVRDYDPGTPGVIELLAKIGVPRYRFHQPAGRVDLRQWCPPVEDQGNLGSCTANAGVGLVEYYERRVYSKYIDASRLFLYKATRELLGLKGDSGADLRSTMKALALYGVPPETEWPYTDDKKKFDLDPPARLYAEAANFKALKYYRHDPAGTAAADVLASLKAGIQAGHPAMFGFTVYSSIAEAEKGGKVPFPGSKDKVEGGHAVVAAGYDDSLNIQGQGSPETVGALLVRNSWGPTWGEAGYMWLPYEYVLRGLASDFWSIIEQSWVDTGAFA